VRSCQSDAEKSGSLGLLLGLLSLLLLGFTTLRTLSLQVLVVDGESLVNLGAQSGIVLETVVWVSNLL